MKRILLLLVLCLNISMVLGQEYKNWEKYDIEGFYIIAKSKAEAKISIHEVLLPYRSHLSQTQGSLPDF